MPVRSTPALEIMARGMDYAMLRHRVLSDNIANADTPFFKRSDVSFQHRLLQAIDDSPRLELKTSSPRHIPTQPLRNPLAVKPRIFTEVDTWSRNDKNNVNPEAEMAELAKNTLYYNTLAQRVRAAYSGLTDVVRKSGAVG